MRRRASGRDGVPYIRRGTSCPLKQTKTKTKTKQNKTKNHHPREARIVEAFDAGGGGGEFAFGGEATVITRARHRRHVVRCEAALGRFLEVTVRRHSA